MGLLNRIFGRGAGSGEPGGTRDSVRDERNPAARRHDKGADGHIAEGLRHHQSGDLRSAERAFREALDTAPDNADVHYLLGSLLGADGRLDAALEHLEQATRLDPSAAAARADMGNVFRAQGRAQAAEAAYRDAIAIDAELPGAHRNLGSLLRELGRSDEAIDSFTRAAALSPEDAEVHFMLGDLLSASGRYREACRSYRAGLVHAPGVAAAHNNLGASLRHLSRDEEAIACFEQALRIDANFASAHENLADMLEAAGSVERAIEHYRAAAAANRSSLYCRRCLGRLLIAEGRIEESLKYCREALALAPDAARSHFELGNALMAGGHKDEAVERFRQAVRLDPADARAQVNLGFALYETGRYEEAANCFRTAIEVDDALVEAHNNLGSVLQQQGELHEAMRTFERALELAPDQGYVRSNLIACMNYGTHARPEDTFEAHRSWSKLLEQNRSSLQTGPIQQPDPERRLRIGYVSADFRFHSVAYFIAPLIEHHDREHFEIMCYSNVTKPDANTQRIKALADGWRDIASLGDQEVAAWIRRDRIDILVDLSGHSVGNRLPVFAERPAPVQVTYLGYPNTTGMQAMDYRLTDARSDPPGQTDHLYSEELVRLDEGFLCYQPLLTCPDVRERGAPQDGDGITFASFNELLKVTPETIATWCTILERIPRSKLFIKAMALQDAGTRQRVRNRFVDQGLAPDRLQLAGRTASLEEHLAQYNGVDVALDTFPYNGTTTTCEALWMGVPVVSLAGDVHASRVGLSVLSCVGLAELVAEDRDRYVDNAVNLATDHELRKRLRGELRERMRTSSLMDTQGCTRRIESAYREMWRNACRRANAEAGDTASRASSMSVRTAGGIRVRVPAAIDGLTTYVLLEQEDWFEDEIHFVRRLLRPGMRCIDIGANYGLYTLDCAKQVGSGGHVWSFEPTPGVATLLAASIAENGFDNVELMRMALSNESGSATLATHVNSEHNFLTRKGTGAGHVEIVDVRRLDEVALEHEIRDVDFVKLDAEGAEIEIIEGGEQFFERESPVVQFEVKNREGMNWELVDALQARGYEMFRLVPGLMVLVPFERDEVDAYQLNLFACTGERLKWLEGQGLAVRAVTPPATPEHAQALEWLDDLGRLPYASTLVSGWREGARHRGKGPPEGLVRALALYCRAADASLPAAERFAALAAAGEALSRPFASTAETARLYSLARISRELGYRQQALEVLDAIGEQLASKTQNLDGMPFLAVSQRFDSVDPGGRFADWCLASVLEQRVKLSAFSSYFQNDRVLEPLEILGKLPFQCAEMERRRQLVRMRFGKQAAPEATSILTERAADNLNPEFWTSNEVAATTNP